MRSIGIKGIEGEKKIKIRNSYLDVPVILVSFSKKFFDFIVEIHKKY